MSALYVPVIEPADSILSAALKYAAAGWYVGPLRSDDPKNPGSRLGGCWQEKTSREVEVIVAWFAGTSDGLFLHAGRSGAAIFDVDRPDLIPEPLARAIAECSPPFQSTRTGVEGRGHYPFAFRGGRVLGNGLGGLGGAFGEIRGRNGVIVVEPTEHENVADGGRYRWLKAGVVPELPAYLDDLLHDATDSEGAATDVELEFFLDEHVASARPELLTVLAAVYAKKIAEGESRHVRMVSVLVGAMKEAAAGLIEARLAADTLESMFLAAVAVAPIPSSEQGASRSGGIARSEWKGLLSWAVGQAKTADLDAVRARAAEKVPDLAAYIATLVEDVDAPSARIDAVLVHLKTWLVGDDPSATYFTAAVAVAAVEEDGEPLWGMLVGPPSSAKTEHVRALDDVADDRLDEVTSAALLSWSKGKKPHPVGVLTRIPDRALVTIGDFSTVLATSDRGGRDQLFASLRRMYDGSLTRDLGNAEGPLRWKGRITLLAAVTPAVDEYSAHSDALGPRWLYLRMPELPRDKRVKSAGTKLGDLPARRATLRKLMAEAVRHARTVLPTIELTDEDREAIASVAVVACSARGSVPRDGYGRREIIAMSVVEEPYRLVQQLRSLYRAARALGLDGDTAHALTRKAALDTIPRDRLAVLRVLADGEPLSVAKVSLRARVHRRQAKRTLEDLRELRLAACPVEDDETVEDPDLLATPRDWQLTAAPEYGELVADVLHQDVKAKSPTASSQGAPKSGDHPPNPPKISDQNSDHDLFSGDAPHFSAHPKPQVSGPEPSGLDISGEPGDDPEPSCRVCGSSTAHVDFDRRPCCWECSNDAESAGEVEDDPEGACTACGGEVPGYRLRSGFDTCKPCADAVTAAYSHPAAS